MWFWFKCICESVWLSVFLLVLWWTGNMPMVYPMTGQARLEGPSSQSENLCAWASICTGCFTMKFVQIVFAIPVSDFLLLPSGKKGLQISTRINNVLSNEVGWSSDVTTKTSWQVWKLRRVGLCMKLYFWVSVKTAEELLFLFEQICLITSPSNRIQEVKVWK